MDVNQENSRSPNPPDTLGECMATHGGARSGAGRPVGGVTQTRRLIAGAIQKGLAQAGRKKFPGAISQDDEEQAAIETGAMIVDDMIQSGQGNDVLKLWAAVASKEGNDSGDTASRNTLAEALSKLPGAGHVVDVTQIGKIQREAAPALGGTSHQEGDAPHFQPHFAPQGTLPLPDPHTIKTNRPEFPDSSFEQRTPASGPPQPEAAGGPPPAPPRTPPSIGQQENF